MDPGGEVNPPATRGVTRPDDALLNLPSIAAAGLIAGGLSGVGAEMARPAPGIVLLAVVRTGSDEDHHILWDLPRTLGTGELKRGVTGRMTQKYHNETSTVRFSIITE